MVRRLLLRRLGRIVTAAVMAALAVSPAPAGYDVIVRRAADYRDIRSVVLYPLECPTGIDCRVLELRLAEDLAELGKYRVFGPAEIRQLASDRGLDLSFSGSLESLMRSLGVDAVVFAGVPGVKAEDRWSFQLVIGSTSVKPSEKTPDRAATITCFTLDGRTLFEGSAEGSSKRGVQIEQEIVARKFKSILKKALED